MLILERKNSIGDPRSRTGDATVHPGSPGAGMFHQRARRPSRDLPQIPQDQLTQAPHFNFPAGTQSFIYL